MGRPGIDRAPGCYLRGRDDRTGIMWRASPAKAISGHPLEVTMATTMPVTVIRASAIHRIRRADPASELSTFAITTTLRSSRGRLQQLGRPLSDPCAGGPPPMWVKRCRGEVTALDADRPPCCPKSARTVLRFRLY